MTDVRVGLEVHTYLATEAKLYCPCPADFLDAEPNTRICPVCTGQPGAKPHPVNRAAVVEGLRIADALACTPAERLQVLRKHYFYPDLPSNYQRTSHPLATEGELMDVGIREVHLEEDPGAYDLQEGTVDLNRSGVPLLEIVTEPDLTSAAEARAFMDELRLLLTALGAVRPDAGVKADVNVSIRGGERVEVKNVNSTRNVARAVEHEVSRQRELVDAGGTIHRETRHFDEVSGETVKLRVKESAADYRYMPDPDVPPAPITRDLRDAARLEDHPFELRRSVAEAAEVTEEEVNVLLQDPGLLEAQRALQQELPAAFVFKFLARDLRGELEYRSQRLAGSRATVEGLGELLSALHGEDVTSRVATRLLRGWLDGELDLTDALEEERSAGVAGDEVDGIVADVIAEHGSAVEDYHAGKEEALNFLMGQVLRKAQGRASPEEVRARLVEQLGEP